jgi:hypothetical protein
MLEATSLHTGKKEIFSKSLSRQLSQTSRRADPRIGVDAADLWSNAVQHSAGKKARSCSHPERGVFSSQDCITFRNAQCQ